jgi:hypothetical protein
MKFIKENNGKLPDRSTSPYLYWWLYDKCIKYRRGQLKQEHIQLFRMQEAASGLKLLPTIIIAPDQQARRA